MKDVDVPERKRKKFSRVFGWRLVVSFFVTPQKGASFGEIKTDGIQSLVRP